MGVRIAVDQMHPQPKCIDQAAYILAQSGVVIMPTDSVYGIGCAALPNNPAHERIFEIKHRDRHQTLPLLVADAAALSHFGVELPHWSQTLAGRYWPGALTLVVKASTAIDAAYVAQDGTIALRVPNSSLVRELARRVGPLAVTSANTHGAQAATSGDTLELDLVQSADLILDGGTAPLGVASTIVDATGAYPRILREGAISVSDIFVTAEE